MACAAGLFAPGPRLPANAVAPSAGGIATSLSRAPALAKEIGAERAMALVSGDDEDPAGTRKRREGHGSAGASPYRLGEAPAEPLSEPGLLCGTGPTPRKDF